MADVVTATEVLDRAAEVMEGRAAAASSREAAEYLATAAVFRQWAWIGRIDPDTLRRIGGDETIALARIVVGGQP